MNGAVVFILLVYAAFIAFAVYSKLHGQADAEDAAEYDTARVHQDVEALSADMRRLKELDDMMLDLRICSPSELQRSFRVEWQSMSGINHKLDICADGENASTERLMALAMTERDELNTRISRRINSLYFRASALDAEIKAERKTMEWGSERATD